MQGPDPSQSTNFNWISECSSCLCRPAEEVPFQSHAKYSVHEACSVTLRDGDTVGRQASLFRKSRIASLLHVCGHHVASLMDCRITSCCEGPQRRERLHCSWGECADRSSSCQRSELMTVRSRHGCTATILTTSGTQKKMHPFRTWFGQLDPA